MAGRYAIQGVPQMQKQTGPLGILGNYAVNKGLEHGLNAYAPGAGTIAGGAIREVAPSLVPRFNMGGKAPLGGGLRSAAELQQARQLGALSQKEYLEALKHMSGKPMQYKNMGGPMHQMPDGSMMAGASHYNEGGQTESNWEKLMRQWAELKAASEESQIGERMERIGDALQTPSGQQQALQAVLPLFRQEGGGIHIKKGNEGKFTAKAKAAGMGVQEYARKVLASDSASPATKKQANFARNAASWHKEDGGRIGPLSKTVHTTSDGEKMEMTFHNPLAGGNNVGEK